MTPTPKKQRKQLTIVEKLQIIEMKEVKGYYACDFARENDPNEARSLTSIKNVLDGIKSYEEEAKERLKN